jgi:hypothetical protein
MYCELTDTVVLNGLAAASDSAACANGVAVSRRRDNEAIRRVGHAAGRCRVLMGSEDGG